MIDDFASAHQASLTPSSNSCRGLTRLVRLSLEENKKRSDERAHDSGSLLFCPDCGTLLNLPVGNELTVVCEQCAHEEPASCAFTQLHQGRIRIVINHLAAYENIEITTRSHPDAFPSALQQKRKTQTKTHRADEVRLRVSEA